MVKILKLQNPITIIVKFPANFMNVISNKRIQMNENIQKVQNLCTDIKPLGKNNFKIQKYRVFQKSLVSNLTVHKY